MLSRIRLSNVHIAGISVLAAFLTSHHAPQYTLLGSGLWTGFALFAVLSSFVFCWNRIIYPKFLSPLRSLPTPPGGSFLNGHGWEILREPTGIPHRRWINSLPNNGLIRYNWFLNSERVFPTSPKALAEVLVTKSYDFEKPAEARSNLGPLLGYGILLAEGEEHKFQRKHLNPAFQYRHVRDLYPVFWDKSVQMVKAVEKEVAQAQAKNPTEHSYTRVDFGNWLSRCTLDIIGLAGMGWDFNALSDPNNELNQAYKRVFTPPSGAKLLFMLSLILPPGVMQRLPIRRNADVLDAARKVRGVSRQMIKEKQAKLAEKPDSVGKDILSVALTSGAFTVENLVDQTMTFLAAGHETTSTATGWALLALAQRPEMQARLREEIREQLPSPSSGTSNGDGEDDGADMAPMTAELMDKLPYLHAVCNEVLRFHAPVPITTRNTVRDSSILGQPIPAGTRVVVAPWAVNFSTELWGDDADQFRPERWLGDKRANTGGADSNFANLTFLHGPRSCIGLSFSKSEFHCLLAAIIGRLDVRIADPNLAGKEVNTGIVARPKGGVHLNVKVVPGW